MKYLEQNTIINTPVQILDQLNADSGNIVAGAISAAYQNAIIQSVKKVNVYKPIKNCQGILPDKLDDFDLTKGLGTNHLSSIIDQLNSFKENQIQNILTKVQAMGPDNAKDIKLAAGIIDTLNKIRQYASCYTSTVKKINSLVDSYLAGINNLIVFYQVQFDEVTNLVNGGQTNLLAQISGITYLSASYLLLKYATTPLDILAATNAVYNDLVTAYNLTLFTENRIEQNLFINLNATITLLQSDINKLLRITGIQSSLNGSYTSGQGMYMTDTYLQDVLEPVQAASYNYSLTNSGALTQYSLDDPKSILPLLSNTQNSVLIDSRTQPGTLIVPNNETKSIVSCGLDIRAGINAQLSMTLEIDGGNTVIQAVSTGIPNGNDIVNTIAGVYITRASEKDLSYTAYTVAGSPAHSYLLTLYSVIGTIFENNQQFVNEDTGAIFQVVPQTQTNNTITVESISTGNPAPPDPTGTVTWIDSNGVTQTSTVNVASLKNNSPSRVGTIVHAGEEISCTSWALYAKAFGTTDGTTTTTVTIPEVDQAIAPIIMDSLATGIVYDNIYIYGFSSDTLNLYKLNTTDNTYSSIHDYTALGTVPPVLSINNSKTKLYLLTQKSNPWTIDELDLSGTILNTYTLGFFTGPAYPYTLYGMCVHPTDDDTLLFTLNDNSNHVYIVSYQISTSTQTVLYNYGALTQAGGSSGNGLSLSKSIDNLSLLFLNNGALYQYVIASATGSTIFDSSLNQGTHLDGIGASAGFVNGTNFLIPVPGDLNKYYIEDSSSVRIFDQSTNNISTYLDYMGSAFTSDYISTVINNITQSNIITDSSGYLYVSGTIDSYPTNVHIYKFGPSSTITTTTTGQVPVTFEGSNAELMFLKAAWGFIPNS